MKANQVLNGEWGKHVTPFEKRQTNKKRRAQGKKLIRNETRE